MEQNQRILEMSALVTQATKQLSWMHSWTTSSCSMINVILKIVQICHALAKLPIINCKSYNPNGERSPTSIILKDNCVVKRFWNQERVSHIPNFQSTTSNNYNHPRSQSTVITILVAIWAVTIRLPMSITMGRWVPNKIKPMTTQTKCIWPRWTHLPVFNLSSQMFPSGKIPEVSKGTIQPAVTSFSINSTS